MKKHISIIGTCATRELFNNIAIQSQLELDSYLFQRCVWDMIGNVQPIPQNEIDKINAENFTVRMLKHSFNKTSLKELQQSGSEYLIIDLYNMRAPVLRVELNNNVYYFQNTAGNERAALIKAKENPYFADMKIEHIELSEIEKLVENGFKEFAAKIKELYQESNIIIHIPKHSQRYYSSSDEILEYPEDISSYLSSADVLNEKWSKFLCNLLPHARILEDRNDTIAMFGLYDDIEQIKIPPAIHHSDKDNVVSSFDLLDLLDLKPSITLNECIKHSFLRTKNQLVYTNYELKKMKVNRLSLNNYFSKIKHLDDFIIIITSKDDASNNLKYFRNRKGLPLSLQVGFRDSYIAIVDLKRNFVYEKAAQQAQTYSYVVKGKTIYVESAGWNAGNKSIVSFEDGKNLSKSSRGLNIVLLNSETAELVDSAYCDSFADKDLFVTSDYFEKATSWFRW